MNDQHIRIRGARQNNLKNLSLDIPINKLTVITGVSGSGKSSLAFDTVFAEGQRRYVETFSSYARQFLDRMDKPQVDRIEAIPPAVAIDQTNPVRTSRSTVGTMTELTDHLKLLYARAAHLSCAGCGREVARDTPDGIFARLVAELGTTAPVLFITFTVTVPENFGEEEVRGYLAAQGYIRVHGRTDNALEVIQDRVALSDNNRGRIVEALETAFRLGHGRLNVRPFTKAKEELATRRFSADLHCAYCDRHYSDPTANLFSFNSPVGACPTCRGFGRVIGIDFGLVVPDESLSLSQGAVKPWQTASYRECQDDLLRFARKRGVPVDLPWRELAGDQRAWVMEGEGSWEDGLWYGVRRFFDWLETKSYKMHIRVLLSKYRAYHSCPACHGARLRPEALCWRLGPGEEGLALDSFVALPVAAALAFCEALDLPKPLDEATAQLLTEIRARLGYLVEVGLGYLTLDRQSRTLSGGEVQRINLTTALGTALTNTLFVLDEPSIGLHPRDIGRLVGILHRLRDAGNTLLVVEHDPEVMRAADRLIDLGPGPGEAGGRIVFAGSVAEIIADPTSLTGRYLAGRMAVAPATALLAIPAGHPTLTILGAAAHNLQGIDIAIPLKRLVCLTGVSGSGKSTLVEEVLHRGLLKRLGRPVEQPGKHRDILGAEQIDQVVLVDQSPLGKTTRSNPVSYVGAFDQIRKLFATQPLARERGYTGSTFSFNAGTGRCPACNGSGFEHVEMQFLSDVYLRCPDCDGQRFRAEVLEVRIAPRPKRLSPAASWPPLSMAQVLELTVAEACDFFAGEAKVLKGLKPLLDVGLGYLRLGQPLPTLSGGEAQRLKLAGHLAQKGGARKESTLFLFDEPTTGLHFHDIATLLLALRRLVAEGHSLLVIEHNLDVIRGADWVIDLGPEGGAAGGELVAQGTPAELAACPSSHTGRALAAYAAELTRNVPPAGPPAMASEPRPPYHAAPPAEILIRHAREHNLKGIDLALPLDGFTVITGVSGSGKSTVAFDILFAEGQRRYLETLNAYARQFVQPPPRPDVDGVAGVPPTVAIEQHTSRGGRKSTVATVTELYHFLRLLFTKLGTQYCPQCDVAIEPQSVEQITATLFKRFRGKQVTLFAPLVSGRKGLYADLAKWAAARGISHLRVDGEFIPTDHWPRLDRYREHFIELSFGPQAVSATGDKEQRLVATLEAALDYGKGAVLIEPPPGRTGQQAAPILFSTSRTCPRCRESFAEPDPRLFSFNSKHGWCPACYGTGLELPGFDEEQSGEEIWWNEWFEGEERTCPVCLGARLRPQALALRWQERRITDFTGMTVAQAERFFKKCDLAGREAAIGRDLVSELLSRLGFLRQVGLDYLTLDRAAPTLSGGEARRIRLAAQLGSNLCGVCYILDEPTIGLHPRDTIMLLDILHRLRAKGNTVVVVEHDVETIRSADRVIDLGPGGGVEGGRLVAQGTVEELLANPDSITGRCLAGPMVHPLLGKRRPVDEKNHRLVIRAARLHNLKGLDVEIPLGRLIGVSGVSGSGKSTLVRMILHENLSRRLGAGSARHRRDSTAPLVGCDGIDGWQHLGRVLEVDQRPIGRTPRSCPATYVGLWDRIRKLFAETPEARLRGYTASRFSFNTAEGRCPDCQGNGMKKIEMSFLPDVTVPCDACIGARFTPETLTVLYRGKTIAEVLAMNISEAVEFFKAHTALHRSLRLLRDVGLGYLTLGQQSPTLSGGEAQRIKLVTELAKVKPVRERPGKATAAPPHALYVLDEPTIGLHMADVEKLIRVLHRLVEAGNTVVVIEHNLDVLAEADWLVDLGPEGGDGGGRIVAQGPPEKVVRNGKESRTATFLGELLRQSKSPR